VELTMSTSEAAGDFDACFRELFPRVARTAAPDGSDVRSVLPANDRLVVAPTGWRL